MIPGELPPLLPPLTTEVAAVEQCWGLAGGVLPALVPGHGEGGPAGEGAALLPTLHLSLHREAEEVKRHWWTSPL